MFQSSHAIEFTPGSGQDRIQIVRIGGSVVLVIADGAGGRSGGAEAAELAVNLVCQQAPSLTTKERCEALLAEVDRVISSTPTAGETTAVIVVVGGRGAFGASVGDSGALMFGHDGVVDLTGSQMRKPFLGTGAAIPVGFSHATVNGTILVATDGLLKYTSREAMSALLKNTPFEDAPAALVNLVRYPSGNLPDDVAVGLCRPM